MGVGASDDCLRNIAGSNADSGDGRWMRAAPAAVQ
jgi:hypothetical protein